MEISAKVVMELRGRTGAGMMDCKKALKEMDGDMEKAIDYLREKGLAAAAKKQSRIAAEGLVGSYLCSCGKGGAIVEMNCETDFVAKTDEFKELVASVAKTAFEASRKDPAIDVDALLNETLECGLTIAQQITEKTAKIGEKITLRRFASYNLETPGKVESYIHMGGKVGVLVEAKCGKEETEKSEIFAELVHDIALQIAAAAPEYVDRSTVKADHLDHEKEILAAQARNEGKPEKIIEKMVEGRVSKFYKEVCLLEQPFVKNPDVSITQLIAEKAKALGDTIEIPCFTRYKMGDGLEKRVNDLAAEVAEQTAAMKK